MKKHVLGPVLAALAAFFFGFIYWGLPHHLPYKTLNTVADDSAAGLALGKLFPASGSYLVPSQLLGEARVQELAARGPTAEVHIRKEPFTGADMGKVMAAGYVHLLAVSVALSFILCGLAKSFERWTCRVKFCAALGLLVAAFELGNAIWWHHALGWTLARAVYDLLVFVIIGLVLAKFVTPKPAPAAPAA
jgi:hypothetical protein